MFDLRIAKLTLAATLLISLGLKLSARDVVEQSRDPGTSRLEAFLVQHGFQSAEAGTMGGLSAVSGSSGPCRIVLADVAPQGWHRDIVRRVAAANDQVLFSFQGRTYLEQPIWSTWSTYYRDTFLRKMGLPSHFEPVYAVVASPACDLTKLAWEELARR